MKRPLPCFAFLLAMAAPAYASTAVPSTCDGGQTVSAEEALQLFKGNVAGMKVKANPADLPTAFVDPRNSRDYAKGHIPGATNLPIEEGAFTIETFQKATGGGDKPVVLYCNGENCPRSHMACEKVTQAGYKGKIYYFYTGLGPNGWPLVNGPTIAGAGPYGEAP